MNGHDWNLLLDRYLQGECSPAEEAVVQQELAALGEASAVAALREARARTAEVERRGIARDEVSPAAVAAAMTRLDQRLTDAGLRPAVTPRLQLRLTPTTAERSPRAGSVYEFRAAAAAFVLLAGGVAAWFTLRTSTPVVGTRSSAMREFMTARGQRGIFQLVDGTQVILDVDTRLRIPADYGVSRRDVYLEGDAYFIVTHDAARPFAVRTAHGITRDIGTKFSVRAYRDDTAEWVAVAEGVVAVTAAANVAAERRLAAGQLAAVSPTGAIAIADNANIDRELAWTRGELHFANVPLASAIRRLSQWYDVDIELADSALADKPVSGVYTGEPLKQVLTLVAAAVGADFEWRGKRAIIFAPTGGPRP